MHSQCDSLFVVLLLLLDDDDDDWGDFGSPSTKPKAATPTKAAAATTSATSTTPTGSGERKLTKFELAQKRKEERLKKKAGAQ